MCVGMCASLLFICIYSYIHTCSNKAQLCVCESLSVCLLFVHVCVCMCVYVSIHTAMRVLKSNLVK